MAYPSKVIKNIDKLQEIASLTTSDVALWVKFSADNILKYYSYFSQKTGFIFHANFLQRTETICMKCQILFSGKNKKNIISLSFAELAQSLIKLNSKIQPVQMRNLVSIRCPHGQCIQTTENTQSVGIQVDLSFPWSHMSTRLFAVALLLRIIQLNLFNSEFLK